MKRIAILVASIALMAPGSALASSSSMCQAYNPQTCLVSGSSGAAADSPSGTLPFTGLDVVLVVVGGCTLVLAGFAVRRVSRRLN